MQCCALYQQASDGGRGARWSSSFGFRGAVDGFKVQVSWTNLQKCADVETITPKQSITEVYLGSDDLAHMATADPLVLGHRRVLATLDGRRGDKPHSAPVSEAALRTFYHDVDSIKIDGKRHPTDDYIAMIEEFRRVEYEAGTEKQKEYRKTNQLNDVEQLHASRFERRLVEVEETVKAKRALEEAEEDRGAKRQRLTKEEQATYFNFGQNGTPWL